MRLVVILCLQLTFLIFKLFILKLFLELNQPMPIEYHLVCTHTTLLPSADHGTSPVVDFPSCSVFSNFGDLDELLLFRVANFHLTAFGLIFTLYLEKVYLDVVFEKLCIFILSLRSSNTN